MCVWMLCCAVQLTSDMVEGHLRQMIEVLAGALGGEAAARNPELVYALLQVCAGSLALFVITLALACQFDQCLRQKAVHRPCL